jgi:hypothetical protein
MTDGDDEAARIEEMLMTAFKLIEWFDGDIEFARFEWNRRAFDDCPDGVAEKARPLWTRIFDEAADVWACDDAAVPWN